MFGLVFGSIIKERERKKERRKVNEVEER